MADFDDIQKVFGIVLDIQRMSTEDGPGLRTTVFLKGCPLNCGWCHNPESISPHPQVVWNKAGCLGCGICIHTCSQKALTEGPSGIVIDRNRCRGCGDCARQCPSLSMALLGEKWLAHDLVTELARDQAYFSASGGGVTLSGGEASLQPKFTGQVLKGLKEKGIHTALDTCGHCSVKTLEQLLPCTDLVLFDIKEMDDKRHEIFTGVSNRKILENLKQVSRLLGSTRLWIRTPIIPDATARKENIRSIGAFIATQLAGQVAQWELCAFNNLAKDKYRRLGRTWAYEKTLLVEKTQMDELVQAARASGVDKHIVCQSGLIRA